MANHKIINISEAFDNFDDIIDVRSPAEFADDHLPGAISLPVLSDDERAYIGKTYTQVSPFEAQKQGAALIARNIARHLDESLNANLKGWRPLIYCWRGGMRSGAMAHILSQVGWRTAQLNGGYKSYRRYVIAALDTLPDKHRFIVICGATGSGKSRLLRELAEQGAQVLDLEQLAQHRGSLLGNLPEQSQPSQKTFESRIWDDLRNFTTDRPVFVEAESRKVGVLTVPDLLLQCMRAAQCIRIEADHEARVRLLMEDYEHFLRNPAQLAERLSLLVELHGHKVIDHWCEMAHQGEWQPLVTDLLSKHYDPAYLRSSDASFAKLPAAPVIRIASLDKQSLHRVAIELLEKDRF